MEPNKVQFALYFLIATLMVIFLSAGAMNMVKQDETIKEYSGVYVREFESHLFYECKNTEYWWVSSGHSTDVDL
ncbi:hypothetical protein [Aliikangiella sp. G2MR2-5]|uniref:hypothetical protein n=1 Tax=Aliikangiella sp. G2MR2-5 TaxID=2788943 RepID=UPI0018ABBAB1|nr:hypothetical protein [Aliikangiella sp. G2MR2-5]